MSRLTVGLLSMLFLQYVQAAPLVYVTNALDASVSVIDTDTNTVIQNIAFPAGAEPVAVAVHPFESFAYVNDRERGEIHVIDTLTHTITDTIILDLNPDAGIKFHPDGSRAYVTQRNRNDNGQMSIIDTETHSVIEAIPMGQAPSGVAIHPEGHTAYVCNFQSDDIYIVDLETSTVVDILPVGSQPQGLTISPDGKMVYVPNRGDDTVSVVDTSLNAIIKTIPVGKRPGLIDFLPPDNLIAYVPQRGVASLAVVDTTSHSVIDGIDLDAVGYVWAAVLPSGDFVYLTNQNGNQVAVINTTTQEIVSIIPVGNFPIGLAVVPTSAMTVDRVSPGNVQLGAASSVHTVIGSRFRQGITAEVLRSRGVSINQLTFVDSDTVLLDLFVAADARVSFRDLQFTNPDGQAFVKKRAFRVVR